MAPPRKPLVIVQHVPWEGPHRIVAAFGSDQPIQAVRPLAGEQLPPPADVAGAVLMGGPMNVDDTASHPALADEREWVERVLELGLPMLGVCLGSQLLARALGAAVTPGTEPEIGWRPVAIEEPGDPLLGPLAPSTTALHWHADCFEAPPGATLLASSAATSCQAFRHRDEWGVLFHPEADAALVDAWLREPAMATEARAVLGPGAAETLRAGARDHEHELVERSSAGFEAFAQLVDAAAG